MLLSISNLDDRIKIGITNERSMIMSIIHNAIAPSSSNEFFTPRKNNRETHIQSNVDRAPLLVWID
jgi:hypothetical protein